MWLRWIVSNYVRQTAQRKIGDLAAQKLRRPSDAGPGDSSTPGTQSPTSEGREDTAAGEGGVREAPEPKLPPRSDFDLAVLFALKIESGGLVDLLQEMVYARCASYVEYAGLLKERPVVLADTGVGTKAAGEATNDIIALVKPKWIVSAGFCGSLTSGLAKDQILMADSVVDLDGNELSVGFEMDSQIIERTPHLQVGRLLTVNELIRTTDEKQRLGEQHGAVACDMESMAIARACQKAGVRFLSVRIVSDGLEDNLPQEIIPLMQQKTFAAKLGAATGALFKRPSTMKDLWKLREEAIRQSDRLAKFLAGVLEQLPT